jgi:hypothetical protein
MPVIDLSDEELAALTAAIRHLIEQDRFPAFRASIRCAPPSPRSSRRRRFRSRGRPKRQARRPRSSKTHKARWRPS